MSDPGLLVVMTGPSGAGKSTILKRVMRRLPELRFGVSYTTRSRRPEEVDGVDYHFIERPRFEALVKQGAFLEHAEVHGNYYGTHRGDTERLVASGALVLLDIDVQGAAQVRSTGLDLVDIFVSPPSIEVLEQRLRSRGTEAEDSVQRRLANARGEVARRGDFRHEVVNDDLGRAVERFLAILGQERQRRRGPDGG